MLLIFLSIVFHYNFEIGIIPDGSALIYNEEYWNSSFSLDYNPIQINVPVSSDKNGIVYYTIFNTKLQQGKFFIGGGIKTYAQKHSYDNYFTPYRTRFDFELGIDFNNFTTIGFNHHCTHTFVDFGNIGIFAGEYEEFYIRFEK
jgi:hypothetical protein